MKHFAMLAVLLAMTQSGPTVLRTQQATCHETKVVTEEELARIKFELVKADATPVQEITLTEQQKGDSRLYKDYRSDEKIKELLAGNNYRHIGFGRPIASPGGLPGQITPSASAVLQELVRMADAVVLGKIRGKTSLLTEDEDFIFTEYEVVPWDVLKDNIAHSLRREGSFTVTRPGGMVLIDGRVVEALDEAYQPLKIGPRYLLFLTYIPATGSYRALHSRSVFCMEDGTVTAMTMENTVFQGMPATKFLDDVRAAVALASNQ